MRGIIHPLPGGVVNFKKRATTLMIALSNTCVGLVLPHLSDFLAEFHRVSMR